MHTAKNRYFIALIPPSPYYEQALELKNYFREHYESKASLNSPPHLTLHMPFEWKAAAEHELSGALQLISSSLSSVKIHFENFGCFAPRVIFIQARPSAELIALQHQLRQSCKREMGLFNADYKDLPFHPHLTLAFRDLKRPAFATAWEEFKSKKFEGGFIADRLTLLKHEDGKWNAIKEFSLTSLAATRS